MIDYMCACHDHAQTSASIRELLYIIGAETCYDVAISRAESLNGGEPAVQMNPLNNGETGQKIQKYRKSIKKPNLTVDLLILIAETIESLSASFLFEKYFFSGIPAWRHTSSHMDSLESNLRRESAIQILVLSAIFKVSFLTKLKICKIPEDLNKAFKLGAEMIKRHGKEEEKMHFTGTVYRNP